MSYVLTTQAQEDLRQIRDYLLEEVGIRVTRRVITAFVGAFHSLVRTPGQGHRRADLSARPELRFQRVLSYLVVYDIESRPLTFIAIVHAKRDVEGVLESRAISE